MCCFRKYRNSFTHGTRGLQEVQMLPKGMRAAKNKTSKGLLDCEQSLFSLKIHGEERKTSSHACLTVSVMYERQCRYTVTPSSTGVRGQAKRETALVSYNDLDAQHSGDRVILLVGVRSYDAHQSVTFISDRQFTPKLCSNVCLLQCDSYGS